MEWNSALGQETYLLRLTTLRRIVKQIEKSADGYFNITADHWEPKEYLEALENQEKQKKQKGVTSQLLLALMIGLAGAAVITQIILPESIAKEKYHELLEKLPGDRPYLQVVFPILSSIIAIVIFAITKPSQSKKSEAKVPESVGTGGNPVGLDEMKLGGSGSAAVMNGRTVGTESIRTKYIVNAAGNYSDKIASMIGDNSFTIQPRIGNYLLLHRNQVS